MVRGQHAEPRGSGAAEHKVLSASLSRNGLLSLQFSFQQGGWGASLADRLVR